MDIQVGDKITYEFETLRGDKTINERIINDIVDVNMYTNNGSYKILKIERPKYELIEEKKELLTVKEKVFLKELLKLNNYEETYVIRKVEDIIYIHDSNDSILASFKMSNLRFKDLEEYKVYTLKELGLEE